MDWSLALASQSIEPVIQWSEETRKWSLLVQPAEYERAMDTIRLYRLENRGWAWRRELPGSELEIHSGALFWCFLLIAIHWVGTEVYERLEVLGRMDSAAVHRGQWWRLFTAVTLHADLAHLMANVTFGVLMLGLAMARFGPGVTLLLAYVAGAFGNLFGLWLYPKAYFGVGASGMMMGALGLLCVHSIGLWRRNPKAARYIVSGVVAGILLFVMFGLNPSSDILAHFGGFISGIFFGLLLSAFPEKKLHIPWINSFCFALLLLLLSITWSLAL
jgi:membrane associated rhomboid family serine protease